VPQTIGTSGWIVLSHENMKPTCTWVTNKECYSISAVLDERLFGDTIFRAEQIDATTYILSDIWLYNSNCIFACSTFQQRYDWLEVILTQFHKTIPGLSIFLHKRWISADMPIRGYEVYDDIPGSRGWFETMSETIVKSEIPDVYFVKGKSGYLRVPDIETSAFLRSKGDQFQLQCVQESDTTWTVTENISNPLVNA
jgi:hypothetical protein